MTEYHLGGCLLFGRDFQDAQGAWLTADAVRANIQSYQTAAESDSGIPLLIGVDEEGGTVVRVSRNPLLREHKFSSPQSSAPPAAWTPSSGTPPRRTPCSPLSAST